MCDQSGLDLFTKPLAVVWLFAFAANYAATLSAASRVRAFNTSLMWRRPGAGAAWPRFWTALAILNGAPLAIGLLVARWAGECDRPTTAAFVAHILLALTGACSRSRNPITPSPLPSMQIAAPQPAITTPTSPVVSGLGWRLLRKEVTEVMVTNRRTSQPPPPSHLAPAPTSPVARTSSLRRRDHDDRRAQRGERASRVC